MNPMAHLATFYYQGDIARGTGLFVSYKCSVLWTSGLLDEIVITNFNILSLPISWAACRGVSTLYGDLNPLVGVKKAGKSLVFPNVLTQTPSVSCNVKVMTTLIKSSGVDAKGPSLFL